MSKVSCFKCSNDEANRLTRKYLCDALLKILNVKSFEQITITELVKEANVSRAGFYNNYKNKFQIIKEIVLNLNHNLLKKIGKPFSKKVTISWYENLFNYVEKIQSTIKLLIKAGFQDEYIQIINEEILNNQEITSSNIAYKRLIWNGGIQNIIWFWVKNGMKQTKQEMAKICFDFFNKDKAYI